MYKRWIQIFAAIDITIACFRLGNATLNMTKSEYEPGPNDVIRKGYPRLEIYDNLDVDNTKFVLLGVMYYILQVLILSLAIFLMVTVAEKNGLKQTQWIHIWTGGMSVVILIYIIYLVRRLYFVEDLMGKENEIWYFDIAEILFRFLFTIFVNKYISFVNPSNNSFDDIDPEIRQAFEKYVFQQTDGDTF